MSVEFTFTNDIPPSQIDYVVDYVRGPRLWLPDPRIAYPDIDTWAQKVDIEMHREMKRALVAYFQGQIIGATIYGRDEIDPNVLKLKNLTVSPTATGRYVASFLLRNTEIEGANDFKGVTSIICDTKVTNLAIRLFLAKNHYTNVGQIDLYGLGAGEDVVFQKLLRKPDQIL